MPKKRETKRIESRFWSKVEKTDGCWIWRGYRNIRGYGYFCFEGESRPAHRVSWEIENGCIPPGFLICHKCDNPSCVKPGHLFLGTDKTNYEDAVSKNRFPWQGREYCKHGHSLSTNTARLNGAKGPCLICQKISQARYTEKNRKLLNLRVNAYYWKNKEKEKIRKARWYQENRDQILAHHKEYKRSLTRSLSS